MAEYQYLVSTDNPDDAELGKKTGLFRLRQGDPLMLAEAVTVEGEWSRSDRLYRCRMMGSDDVDFHEIDEARAERILNAWVENGRIKRLPTPGQNDRPSEENVERMKALEGQARAIWSAVPVPDGAENIGRS